MNYVGDVLAEGIEWLNRNSGAVQGLATIILAGITARYVVLTRRIADAARDSLDQTTKLVESSDRQAEASAVLAAEAQRSRSLNMLPLVVCTYAGGSTPNDIRVRLQNRGSGTAIAVGVRWTLPELKADGGSFVWLMPAWGRGTTGSGVLRSTTNEQQTR